MKECKVRQFFEDGTGCLSMSNLLLFGSFLVTATIMLQLTYSDKMTENYLGIFLTAFVANMAIKRAGDYKIAQAENPKPAGTP